MTYFSRRARAAHGALLAAALFLPLTGPGAAAAQVTDDRLEGTVVLDGNPVPGVPVTLHRVTSDTSGVVASSTTSDDGRFRFDLPPRDTAGFTVYFATADHLSVRYFGDPVHPGDQGDAYRVEVRDTTSDSDGVLRLARRDMVLVPHADGGWEVNEVVRLRNSGERTIVSSGGMPAWEMGLPSGAQEFEAGAGDLPAEQVRRMGNRVLLLAAIQPGVREIFVRYRIPAARRAELAAGTPTDSINIFVQQPSPGLTVSGLRPIDIVTVENQRFLQLSAAGLSADSTLTMEWRSAGPPIEPVWAGVGAAALLLAVGAGAAVRNRRP